MNTEVDELTPTLPGQPSRAPSTTGGPHRRSTRAIVIAIAAVAVAIGGVLVAVAAFGGDDDPDPARAAAADGDTLELTLGADDPLASCLAFDVTTLSGMSPAFAGTATAVADDTITLRVDRWYAGGTEPTVVLNTTPGMEALIGGIAFEVGQQYLVTAANGTVNFCGYSGAATPEMTAAFDEAFSG